MKKIFLIITFFGVLISFATVASTPKRSGKITTIDGKFAFMKVNNKWKRLKKGSPIYGGAIIKTGKNTRLVIKFNDSSVFRIAGNSKIAIDKAMVKTPEKRYIAARLVIGKLWAKIAKSKVKQKNVSIKTRTATAGVRGTTFDISHSDNDISIVSLYTGSLDVKSNKKITNKKEKKRKRDMRNYNKRERKEISGPKEVSLKKYNQVLLKQMQRVKISADGSMEQEKISENEDSEWVQWNKKLDEEMEKK